MSNLATTDPNGAAVEQLEASLLRLPQLELPIKHLFGPGVYIRQMDATAGSFIIGHRHKTANWNFLLKGKIRVLVGSEMMELTAPHCFLSEANVRKVGLVLEDVTWASVHPTNETDLVKLEEELIVKSQAFLSHAELKAFGYEPERKELPCLG